MSQPAVEISPQASSPATSPTASAWSDSAVRDEFDYTPVSPWGPIALVMGLGGLTGYLGIFGLGLAFCGILIGLAAIVRIKASAGTFKGMGFAVTGLILSVSNLIFGSLWMAHNYSVECPEGFQRVNFPNEIAAKQFVFYGPQRRLHPDVAPLIGQQVFLKGFMWQTQKSEGITEFVFLKDNGECCFGGEPAPYDMMVVRMADGQTTRAYTGMVAVAGVLNANVNAAEGQAVYTVDASLVEEARTRF
jgi:hypothetical protein